MKRLFLTPILLMSSPARGQSLDAAVDAYNRKDYVTALRVFRLAALVPGPQLHQIRLVSA